MAKIKNSPLKLFNANGQTLLYSLQLGAAGYSGIMANFFPELYVWLYNNYAAFPERAQRLSDILSMAAFTEGPAYPITAKYFLNRLGMNITLEARSAKPESFRAYDRLVVEQMLRLASVLKKDFD